jgi:hypothetical protein
MMIIRILGEGQLQVDEAAVKDLSKLDAELEVAVEKHDEAAFHAALEALLARAREAGTPLPADAIEPSDLILPNEGSTMSEVHDLLADGGLIPG